MLLYIEDNKAIGENVVAYLESEGWQVQWEKNGKDGLAAAMEGWYDCIILDIMLPGMDGFSVCRELRKHKQIPIIMTTAKGTIDDKREGFTEGADDYLVKPFEMAELVMRIESILKRSQLSESVQIGTVDVYLDQNQCLRDGKEIHLTTKERQLLMTLLDAQGITVTRATIVEELRGDAALYENNEGTLDVYIANLRKKIGKEYIVTVKGVGYRLVR